MKSRVVLLFAILAIALLAAQSNPVHANQKTSISNAPIPLATATEQPLAKPIPIFGKPLAYDSGGTAAAPVVVADVNGDGKSDVIVGNCCTDPSTISVLLGNGDGTLQAPVAYSAGGNGVEAIAVGDVNGDGHPDLVVATYYQTGNPDNGGLAVLLGNCDGTFRPPISYGSSGSFAISVVIADVNGDGHPDLIVANYCQVPTNCNVGNISVLQGNGDGTFLPPVSYNAGSGTRGMAVADVNGDGKPDVIVENGSPIVTVLLNNGDGTFQPFATPDVGGFILALAVGDVNGDGKPDLLATVACPMACPTAAVSVLLGNGDGTFQSPILSALPSDGEYFGTLTLQDLDGDGKPDVATASYYVGRTWVLLGNGDGTFQAPEKYAGDLKATFATVADLNGDGKPDLVMASECGKCKGPDLNLQVLLNIFDAATATALTSSPNPSIINQSVTFTATFTSNPPVPDGIVITFLNGKDTLGTGVTKNGVATLTTSFAKAKSYTVRVSYPGDRFHKPSSGSVKQVVNP